MKKDNSLIVEFIPREEFSKEEYMAYLTKRFRKIIRKNRGFRNGENPPRAATTRDTYHKCGKTGHFIWDCLCSKLKTKSIKSKDVKRTNEGTWYLPKVSEKLVDYVVKKLLAAWGDSSSESGDSDCPEDASMLVIQDEANMFDEMFSLMDKSYDEDDEDNCS